MRDFFINGESMVSVKGPSGSLIASITQLGLSDGQIPVNFENAFDDLNVNAWGKQPVDVQSMTLIHFDPAVLNECYRLSQAGAAAAGVLNRAGTRMGGGFARFAPGNNYIGLNILSPVEAAPYRFYFAYLTTNPLDFPLGTEKSVVTLNWRCIPYTQDPWQNGFGAQGTVWFDRLTDS